MYELKVVTKFAAAHQLTMVGSKCENMHGHNWKIEVYVKGEKTDEAGVYRRGAGGPVPCSRQGV